MFNIKQTATELDVMLYELVTRSPIFVPINKDKFSYKKYQIVRQPEGGWNVILVSDRNIQIANTFLKVSAFAVCTLHDKRQYNRMNDVLEKDALFEKNYLDSLSYKHILKKSKDSISKDTAMWRYEIVHATAKDAKDKIDHQFYSSIA
jgi:hypothetical protein